MKKFAGLLVALFILGFSGGAKADVLVLIHGYLGSPGSWEESGVASVLEQNGWSRAGIVSTDPGGRVHLLPAMAGQKKKNKVYIVSLPSIAPINFQAYHLQQMLNFLNNRHGGEQFILAGHSVGGVVARLAIVKNLVPAPHALITIASPHLGTPRAGQALDFTDSPWPVEVVKDIFGGPQYNTLKSSRSLYYDISGTWPGSLLYQLNNSPHPKINYVSILRGEPFMIWGDNIVPTISQDMNNVPQLRGKSIVYTSGSGHSLVAADGFLLAETLKYIASK
ncbi:MAG: alpha/beta fold hydrolase [Magnetococcales bacterium]|nr:alpha/beta fold hydrolase [Magnetococcales bacterium]